jgi:NhaP-type Na+/H+ or K+/H+ antiporter
MTHATLIQLSSILIAGTAAQWLAWRFKLPSIVLLLLVGFALGPVSNFIEPDALFGRLLFPFVSLSVAVILFEGGLTLKFSELKKIGPVVIRLITLGALTTWFGVAILGYYVLGLQWKLSLLLGAILIVTGPTVVGPLLRHVRPKEKLASVLQWEGIVTDPFGAICAFLVFETILAETFEQAPVLIAFGVLKSVLAGLVVGCLGAIITVTLLRRYLMPDHLHGSASLTIVVGTYLLSDLMYPESGLLATTVMGIFLANQTTVGIKHVAEFKEHLQVLLISTLFIVLSARVDFSDLQLLSTSSFFFVIGVIFLVRPLAILVSTVGSKEFSIKEGAFLSWVAPRGIVAAAVASVFSLKLVEAGYPAAEKLVPITFLIIVVTAVVYGSTALPVARLLGVKELRPKGLLIIGANKFGRALAGALESIDVHTVLFDTNRRNILKAKQRGFMAYFGNILSETFLDSVNLSRIGKVLALTDNDETNSLAVIRMAELFGKSQVYQLPSSLKGSLPDHHLRGRELFSASKTFDDFEEMLNLGFVVKATPLTEEFDYDAFKTLHDEDTLLLLVRDSDGLIDVVTDSESASPSPGETVVTLSRTA